MSSHRARFCPLVLALALVGLGGPSRGEDAPRTGPASTPNEGAVELVPVTFDEMLARIAANKKAKLTLVDAWATWCGPCKENFPHLVEMHQKYAGKGLAVVSLSLDDPDRSPRRSTRPRSSSRRRRPSSPTSCSTRTSGVGFDKLDINAIPAVFLFGPDGKEVKRFTMDDPEQPVHLRGGREGRRGPARRQAARRSDIRPVRRRRDAKPSEKSAGPVRLGAPFLVKSVLGRPFLVGLDPSRHNALAAEGGE